MSLETNVVKSRKGLRDGYVATNIGSVDKRVFDDPDHIEVYCNYVSEIIDYRSTGERVRELRKEKELLQKEFGEKVGYSPSAILKIETNLNYATDKTLQSNSEKHHESEDSRRNLE